MSKVHAGHMELASSAFSSTVFLQFKLGSFSQESLFLLNKFCGGLHNIFDESRLDTSKKGLFEPLEYRNIYIYIFFP